MVQYEQIDILNIDEMTNGLMHAGEACFKRGEFKEALDLLLRCIRAPKNEATKLSEAKSYRLLGMIYGYLGQEMLSKENLLRGLQASRENGYEREVIDCYISLAFFHAMLKDYEHALAYQTKVLPLIRTFKEKEPETGARMEIVCRAYRGMICTKMGQAELGEEFTSLHEELSAVDEKLEESGEYQVEYGGKLYQVKEATEETKEAVNALAVEYEEARLEAEESINVTHWGI